MTAIQRESLLSLLKNPTSVIVMLGFAFLFFDAQYFLMSRMIGYRDEMCVPGAGLNTPNIIFSVVISLMAGLLIIGFIETLKRRQASYSAISASGVGAFIGTLTVFCPICTLPILSVFGAAMGFTVKFDLWFKLISVVLMAFGLYLLDKQIKGTCEFCVEE